jgi:hypothetical protein
MASDGKCPRRPSWPADGIWLNFDRGSEWVPERFRMKYLEASWGVDGRHLAHNAVRREGRAGVADIHLLIRVHIYSVISM